MLANRTRSTLVAFLMALLISSSLFLSACQTTSEPDQVSVRLKWAHQTQFAGLYVADKEGYYAEENLIVQLDPADPEQITSSEKVLAGENDFGISAPQELLIARSQGKPVRAIAVIFRLNPWILMAPAEAGITKPADLVGKTVAYSPGQGEWLYKSLINNLSIDSSQINETEMTTFDIFKCWETADICNDYAINGLARAKQEGIEATAIWPSDYGISFYADILFTTDQMIEEHPDLVQRFVRATLNGWQKAIEDPDLGTEDTLAFDSSLDAAFQHTALEMAVPLIDTGQEQLGRMDPEVWQQMYELLQDQGVLAGGIDVASVYTNQFIEDLQ